jgi:predicted nucleic acid-binding protein
MILCDTNIFIHAFNGNVPTINELVSIGLENIALPSIVVMELLQGMGNKFEMAGMQKKIRYYPVVHLNESVSRHAILLIGQYKLSHNLQIPDAIIAATTLVNDLPLFTYNRRDFAFVPGLDLHIPMR